ATLIFYFSVICATARSTLFPYTTLFRSRRFSASLQYCPDTADHDGGDGSLAAGRIQSAATARGARALGIYSFLGEEDRGRSADRSEEHTSELQSREKLVCRLLLEKKKKL